MVAGPAAEEGGRESRGGGRWFSLFCAPYTIPVLCPFRPMTTPPPTTSLRFGRFELQARERRLLVDGRAARLGARAFDLLLALAERADRLGDKGTLIEPGRPG